MNKILVLFILILSFVSCDQMSALKNKAVNWIRSDSSTASKTVKLENKDNNNQKAKKTTEKPSASTPKSLSPSTPNQQTTNVSDTKTDTDIIITRDEDKTKQETKSTELKTVKAPSFKVEAPVHVLQRVGGVARYISADSQYIYIDFPQHFAIYNHNFERLALKSTAYPVQNVQKFTRDGRTFFFLKEALPMADNDKTTYQNYTLEIFELIKSSDEDQTNLSLKEIISKDMETNFYWIDDLNLISIKQDKILFLDFTELTNIKIITELPLRDIQSVYVIQGYLYLARNQFLDIIRLKDYQLISSIRVGKPFSFLGPISLNEKYHLVIAYLTQNGDANGLQFLRLTDDYSGISDFTENINFPYNLRKPNLDPINQIIIGQESNDGTLGPVQLFSIKYKRFLRGLLSSQTHILAWSFEQSQLYMVNDKEISINQINLDDKVISQAESIQNLLENKTSLPLAQIGATKIVKDEYQINILKKLEFMADARKVVLLDKNHFIVFENTIDNKTHSIFTTNEFDKDEYLLSEPNGSRKYKFSQLLSTNFGLFAYTKDTNKIYFLDVDFKGLTELPLKIGELISWDHFSTDKGEILALTMNNQSKSSKIPSYFVNFYALKSPQEINLISSLTVKDKPFVFYIPDKQIVILTKNQMELYDWDKLSDESQINKQKQINIKPEETVNIEDNQFDIIAAKISPSFDAIYALINDNNRLKILAMNVFDIKDKSILYDFDIDEDQFFGSSFSKDGRLFILPTNEGTLFFDATYLRFIKEVAHWPVPSYYVDVADRGSYICVALGYMGVYCGELLF